MRAFVMSARLRFKPGGRDRKSAQEISSVWRTSCPEKVRVPVCNYDASALPTKVGSWKRRSALPAWTSGAAGGGETSPLSPCTTDFNPEQGRMSSESITDSI